MDLWVFGFEVGGAGGGGGDIGGEVGEESATGVGVGGAGVV